MLLDMCIRGLNCKAGEREREREREAKRQRWVMKQDIEVAEGRTR